VKGGININFNMKGQLLEEEQEEAEIEGDFDDSEVYDDHGYTEIFTGFPRMNLRTCEWY
jgi:hypothetical protein